MAGPYILARYRKFSKENPDCRLCLVEFGRASHEYLWEPSTEPEPFERHVLSAGHCEDLPLGELSRRLVQALKDLNPDVLVIAGYGVRGMLPALKYARSRRKQIRCVLLSESTREDAPRSLAKEWLKSRLIGLFDAGLVGGTRQRRYLASLGMPHERITEGCNVVDTAHFSAHSSDHTLPEPLCGRPFFLTVARMVRKKNLSLLLQAYHRYLDCSAQPVWDLVIVGDGEERASLQKLAKELDLRDRIHFEGFQQYDALPAYYHAAGCFVLPSHVEPWGLVVNEAMSAGLPVLVSHRCGCVEDLVVHAGNGYVFDPDSVKELANFMCEVANNPHERLRFSQQSKQIIANWSPGRFAVGLRSAINIALKSARATPSIFDLGVLAMASRR